MKGIKEAPIIEAGIFSGNEIAFTLNDQFRVNKSDMKIIGKWIAKYTDAKIVLEKDSRILEMQPPVFLAPVTVHGSSFTLHNVTIGVDFHWQRKEDQSFNGSLKIIIESDRITAVNVLSVEDYLTSVISSEMRATSSLEFLRAHAVVSRSWLLAQMEKTRKIKSEGRKYIASIRTTSEIIRWYDREDHQNYDVCADDHCQRYQGITRASTPSVVQVIRETCGEVLSFEGSICDTRYYKCCGGMTELFENTWEPVNHPYLKGITDNAVHPEGYGTELSRDDIARKWILGNPDAFCKTSDREVLSQVLNDYDQETNDFFRWKVYYNQNELSELVKTRTGIDFGTITDIIPVERGVSGRIIKLKIEGTLKTMIIGKELEIRKSLSKSHLYSSCFVVEKSSDDGKVNFILYGAGWGHGVGLCQIGAAMMGAKGYSYREILMHYFAGASLEKLY